MNLISSARLIGIDGLGGAGKTTFANKLQSHLANAILFHLDDFIHPRNIRYDESVTEWEAYYYKQWRFDYLRKILLQPLANGLPVNANIEFYHKETDQYVRKPIYNSSWHASYY